MAFQTKTFLSIIASMINRMRSITTKITDFNVGSVTRTMVEAPAQEIDQLYQQMVQGLIEAIQVSVYTSFNFPPLPAVSASGLIRVTISVQSVPVLIGANTNLTRSDGSFTYVSTADTTIAAGASFGDVPVVGTVPGTGGNQPALGTFTPGTTVTGFISATNLQPFVNGAPLESPAAQKVRFNAYIQTLSRGTVASLLYALTQLTFLTDSMGNVLERVATANVVEPYKSDPTQPPGLITAYIHNGVGNTSQNLVVQANDILEGYTAPNGTKVPGYVAAGVVLNLFVASEIPVDVIGMLTIGPTFDQASVVAEVTAAIYTYIQGIPVGEPYLAFIANDLIGQVKGVWNWMPVSPAAYVNVSQNSKLVPGQFQIIGWLAAETTIQTLTTGTLS